MSNLAGFLFESTIGIAVLSIFCRMIFNLYKIHKLKRPNYYAEIKPTKPWPRK